ncbi:hypothetical protein AAZU54_06220 [Pseudomonas sp. Je.1.5.c]|uniref:hypothetical protein n=1 Tax=unclassified Pseudomonas TaxID=196821 RepID=UPI0028A2506F|nr:hypothetical protein [Pseudomonas sp.]
MMKFGEFQAFMRCYFPTFLLGFFTCVMSGALSLAMWIDSHWRNHSDNPLYTLMGTATLALLLCAGHFAMIRGLKWAMWVVLPVPFVALLMALSLLGSGLNAVLLAILLALPLLAAWVFNSERHREMRRRLVELRRQR